MSSINNANSLPSTVRLTTSQKRLLCFSLAPKTQLQPSAISSASKPSSSSSLHSSNRVPASSALTEAAARTSASVEKHIERIRKAREPANPISRRPSAREPVNRFSRPNPKTAPACVQQSQLPIRVSPPLDSRSQAPAPAPPTDAPRTRERSTRPPVVLRSALRKPNDVRNHLPLSKMVHFQHEFKTVSDIRYYVPDCRRLGKYIREKSDTNTPHIEGFQALVTSSTGKITHHVRYDGLYHEPSQAGLAGNFEEGIFGRCPYCSSLQGDPRLPTDYDNPGLPKLRCEECDEDFF